MPLKKHDALKVIGVKFGLHIPHVNHFKINPSHHNHCSANRVLTLRVYVFMCQNRGNLEVNSVSVKIGRFDEFDRVNTR